MQAMKEGKQAETRARLHAVVHGRVQGVSFRYFAWRRAQELELSGYVQNRWDGTVEVVAEGSRPALEEMLAYLRQGPRAAFVTDVDVRWPAPTGNLPPFEVRH
jgi:acylphosphatase